MQIAGRTKRCSRTVVSLVALLALALGSAPALWADEKAEKSLYDRLGGVPAIAAVVDDFVNRLLEDPVITANPRTVEAMKHTTVPGLKFQLTALVCQVADGPQKYTGRSMKAAHEYMGITEREWDAMAADFKMTLDRFKVPSREQQELFAAIGMTKKDIVTKP